MFWVSMPPISYQASAIALARETVKLRSFWDILVSFSAIQTRYLVVLLLVISSHGVSCRKIQFR